MAPSRPSHGTYNRGQCLVRALYISLHRLLLATPKAIRPRSLYRPRLLSSTHYGVAIR